MFEDNEKNLVSAAFDFERLLDETVEAHPEGAINDA